MKINRILFVIFINVSALLSPCKSIADPAFSDTITIVPNSEYDSGSIHRFFFGDTWRDLWATPMEVPVINLETYAGGLTVLRKGGGLQTRSLKFNGADGKVYKFRSIQKYTDKLVPENLHNTIVEDITKDIFSTTNPMAPIIATPIINAVGVLQATPIIVALPDSDLLGELREEYGGLVGTFEVHPDEYDDKESSFASADKVYSTYKLFRNIREDNAYQVDEPEFLKARLLDLFLGDWDRHYDQWRWAEYDYRGRKFCKPIPRDRDQVFCRYDGLVPRIVSGAIIQVENCGEEYSQIADLSWSGRYLDRKFLSRLDKPVWDSLVTFISERISDSLIYASVGLMPKQFYDKAGDELVKILISRRNKLAAAADDYYHEMAKYCDIHASDKSEYCVVKRLKKSKVEVSIYNLDKDTKKGSGEPFYHRIFDEKYTKEIRIYLHGGDDRTVVKGKSKGVIKVMVIGGKGKDYFNDKSEVKGGVLGFLPKKTEYMLTYFYDHGEKSKFKGKETTWIETKKMKIPNNDTAKFEPPVRDWGHDWTGQAWFSVNSDDNLLIGGGPVLYALDFDADPFFYRIGLNLGYSTRLQGFKTEFDMSFPTILDPAKTFFKVYVSDIDFSNFFGFGNETKYSDNLDSYRKKHFFLETDFHLEWTLFGKARLLTGSKLRLSDMDDDKENILNDYAVESGDNASRVNMYVSFNYDSRDSETIPSRGVYFDAVGEYFPENLNKSQDFRKISTEGRIYFSGDIITDFTIALRAGGEKSWGAMSMIEASYMGGYGSLRGFEKHRFAGDAQWTAGAELRFFISEHRIVVPGKFGMMFFGDAGQVFYKSESSDLIHASLGSGIWISFVEDDILLSYYIAKSEESWGSYINFGFMF